MKYLLVLFLPLLACSPKLSLTNSEFHDLAVITSNEQDHSLIYRFADGKYAIEYFDQASIPKTKYIIEEGEYKQQGSSLVLTPSSKLFCEIFSAGHDLPCHRLRSFSSAYVIHRPDVDASQLARLGFVERSLQIYHTDKKTMFIDPALDSGTYVLAGAFE